MNVAAVIPARGGSKGIPRKNLQLIGGVPLLGWVVRAALAADLIDAVYVSTEDAEIASVANKYGATVIDRPAELAADDTLTHPVILHSLEHIGEVDAVAILQCTSPLTTGEDIDNAVSRIDQYDAVVSVEEDHGYIVTRDGKCLTYGDEKRQQRQAREPRYRINGAVWVVRPPLCDLWPDKLGLCVMPPCRSVDIDLPVDLHKAESLMGYGGSWIVLGAGPDAREMLRLARARYPHSQIITTNEGIELFADPDFPDVYVLNDQVASRTYADRAKAIQKRGCRLVTLRRDPQAMRLRGVDHCDEFLPFVSGRLHVPGSYCGGLSGLLCLQYALNHGAKSVHLVGMNGYTGKRGGDYFDEHEPDNKGRKRAMHTESIIQPFTQSAVDVCPDVGFVFYGQLNYSVAGQNVRRMVPQ